MTITRGVRKLALATAIGLPLLLGGCVHGGYYDYHYHDYHRWGPDEREPYAHWEAENHRQHVEYSKLSNNDKQAYWDWRHNNH
jgi:hypothetical protein